MLPAAQALADAITHHQAGDFQQAENIYRQILAVDPANIDALHLLGLVAHQVGSNDVAVDYLSQALRLKPDFAEAHHNLGVVFKKKGDLDQAVGCYQRALGLQPHYVDAHYNLGIALMDQGKFDEAAASFQRAISLRPAFPAAHNNLGIALSKQQKFHEAVACFQQTVRLEPSHARAYGNLGRALEELGRWAEAAASYQQALRLQPEFAEARANLGSVLEKLGKRAQAVASFQEAVPLQPDFAVAHNNMGNALRETGRLAEAEAVLRQVLSIQPDYAGAHCSLGLVLAAQGRPAEAVASFQEAVRLQPDFAVAHNNLGNALRETGRLAEAEAVLRQFLRIQPDYASAHCSLGLVLAAQGRLDEAVASYQQALRIQPDHAQAHNNLGNALLQEGRLAEAEASYQQALRIQPDYADAHNNLANAHKDQGRLDDAIAAYRTALRLKPEAAHFHSNVVFALNYHPRYDARAIQEECQRWNQQHALPLKKFIQPHGNHADPERRLRIGYVSPDFRDHVDSYFTIPLLSNHDHRQFEIVCYAGVERPDAVTDRLRGYADIWRSTVALSDQELADLVRSDQIDILVDLELHVAYNRLLMFARKPAPVQVAWLGYPGTTGLPAIDYRLTDPYLDPPGLFDAFYTEESIRLPDTFWCYDPLTDEPSVNALPARANGLFTFGCLNNFCKLNDDCLQLWARVLQAVPQSRLLLRAPPGQAREHVAALLQQEGIAASHVEFVASMPRLEYLRLYHRIDMVLDPLPYNGHTTSLDAFWMGVPTLTLLGKTVVGRAGWSQLSNLGLQELAAETPEQFVELANRLTGDLPRLEDLRSTLRQRMQQSPLMDGKRFARNMEQAYRQMWHKWCRQAPATDPSC
jgi:protein O-GlcNAc transferase